MFSLSCQLKPSLTQRCKESKESKENKSRVSYLCSFAFQFFKSKNNDYKKKSISDDVVVFEVICSFSDKFSSTGISLNGIFFEAIK